MFLAQAGDDPRNQIAALTAATQATGGLAAIVTLVLLARREWLQEQVLWLQREAHQLQVDRYEYERADTVRRQIVDLKAAATEHLASDKIAVQLGGLHMLDQLGKEHPDQREAIVAAWCSLLRGRFEPPPGLIGPPSIDRTAPPPHASDTAVEALDLAGEYQVRMTAQRLLLGHLRDPRAGTEASRIGSPETAEYWSLRQLDLTGATLINADLTGCYLIGFDARYAIFHGQTTFADTLFSGEAAFTSARFRGDVCFDRAVFEGASDFDAVLVVGRAQFTGTAFRGAMECKSAHFTGPAVFQGTQFEGHTRFWKARFGGTAYFEGACFFFDIGFASSCFEDFANFTHARFLGRTAFGHTAFVGAATFVNAQFGPSTVFVSASFYETVDFTDAYFDQRASFESAEFADTARFRQARFAGTAGFHQARFEADARFTSTRFDDQTGFGAAYFGGDVELGTIILGDRATLDLTDASAALPEPANLRQEWPTGWHTVSDHERLYLRAIEPRLPSVHG
ncbi:pentapeptide repeat-containing protein [Glycomyces sp. A-F 0318]|uniref:pentapeptide repeat-containing protein n=1 Tax=Glycomyces amatae TaxID=2881355 RepID=UPI001E33665E|nr:pentapeptide repeat-containing protein [Glycomyces amatae]MCD0444230.1 pentapeptide repeat-containing protein [Glycomyces amatae]